MCLSMAITGSSTRLRAVIVIVCMLASSRRCVFPAYQCPAARQEAGTDAALVTDWDHVFWAANVLLANATDQGAFHSATQSMLKQWICATSGIVRFTPKGRAWNPAAPTLGATVNTALLSLMYGQTPSRYLPARMADRFTCFARSQLRYVLGDSGRSLMAGWGTRPPTAVQNRAASCPQPAGALHARGAAGFGGATRMCWPARWSPSAASATR